MGRIVAISGGNLLTTRPLNKYAIKFRESFLLEQRAMMHRNIFTHLQMSMKNLAVR